MKSARTSKWLRRTLAASLPALLAASAPGAARAADPAAEALFRAGKQAAAAGDFTAARQKFLESQKLEPAPGTLLNLGDCEEQLGHFVEASRYFQSAIALYRPGDSRISYAKQRVASTESHLAHVVLIMAPSAAAGTKVSLDGVELEPAALGRPIPADPGEHVALVRAPTRREGRYTLKLTASETKELRIQPGEPLESAPAAAPAPTAVARDVKDAKDVKSAPAAATYATEPARTRADAGRTLGYVSLGVGAVGVGVGLLAGLFTMSAKNEANEHCPTQGCDDQGLAAQDRGKAWSTVSTVSFIAGGVGLVAGAGLLLFRPTRNSASSIAACPIAGGAGIQWAGQF